MQIIYIELAELYYRRESGFRSVFVVVVAVVIISQLSGAGKVFGPVELNKPQAQLWT